MKIVLCSAQDSTRERWRKILQGYNYSLYQAASMEMLQTIVHKNEQYLLLVHESFMDLQSIAALSGMPDVYKVFVFSDAPDKNEGIVLLQRGVVGYANTYISEGRLVEAVKAVYSGRVWFSQEIMARFVRAVGVHPEDMVSGGSEPILENLTEREKEIALLVAEGLSNHEIGEKLFISDRTVKSHLGTIFEKTGLKSRLKLALVIHGHK